jgi:hypothetical protein
MLSKKIANCSSATILGSATKIFVPLATRLDAARDRKVAAEGEEQWRQIATR